MNESENINHIEKEIGELKNKKNALQKEIKIKKLNERKKLRLKSDTNGKSNILTRVSKNFANKLDSINDKREINGFDRLSNPKITELIVKHKTSWNKIQEDIVNYNIDLDVEEDIELDLEEESADGNDEE